MSAAITMTFVISLANVALFIVCLCTMPGGYPVHFQSTDISLLLLLPSFGTRSTIVQDPVIIRKVPGLTLGPVNVYQKIVVGSETNITLRSEIY
jgi:hypothetical protein